MKFVKLESIHIPKIGDFIDFSRDPPFHQQMSTRIINGFTCHVKIGYFEVQTSFATGEPAS